MFNKNLTDILKTTYLVNQMARLSTCYKPALVNKDELAEKALIKDSNTLTPSLAIFTVQTPDLA